MANLNYPPNIQNDTFVAFSPLITSHTSDNVADQTGSPSIPLKTKKSTTTTPSRVFLYHPNMLEANSQLEWNSADGGAKAVALDSVYNATGFVDFFKKGANAAKQYDTQDILTGGLAQELLAKKAGRILNPKKTMFFKGVGFREFSFTFNFTPESREEAETVKKIVVFFKKHSHPNGGAHLSYPSEWQIDSIVKGKHLMLFKPSVITAVNVNMAPNQVLATFDNGIPVDVKMSLSFKETHIIKSSDYNKVPEGFGY